MRKSRIILIVFSLGAALLSISPRCVWAQRKDAEGMAEIFKKANALYRENKYDESARAYEAITQSGFESGALYYNLGNAYFKKGEFAKALLSYERARFLIPGDSDLESNEEYCRLMLNIKMRKSGGNIFFRILDRASERMTVDGLALFLLILNVVFFLILILDFYVGGVRRYSKPVLAVALALFILFFVALERKAAYYDVSAFVMNKEAVVRFEPLLAGTTYFKLSEGNRVDVLEKVKDWYKIKRDDGKVGWIESRSLELYQK